MIDLENPPVYTTVDDFDANLRDPQKLFDYVMAHLIKQAGPSMDKGPMGGCRYRGADGHKCAAGHILPDNLFEKRPSINNLSLIHIVGPKDAKERKVWRDRLSDQFGFTAFGDNPPAIFIDMPAWTYLHQNIVLVIRLQQMHDHASMQFAFGNSKRVWHQALFSQLQNKQQHLPVDISRVYTYLKKLTGQDLSDRLAP